MTEDASARPGRALIFSNLAHYYNHVIMLIFSMVVLKLENHWGLSFGELTGIAFFSYLMYGLAALPAGWLADRWSTRGMLAIYMLGTGAATILTGYAGTPWQLGIGLGAMGLFASIYHPVGTSFVVRHAVNRGKALGLNGVFGTAGVATAAVIAGTLTDAWGWRMAFVVPGAVCFLTGIGFLLMTREDGSHKTARKASASDLALDRRTIIRAFSVLAVTMTCAGFIAQGFLFSLPKVFSDGVAFISSDDSSGLGRIVTMALLIGASGQLLGGYLAEKFSIKSVYLGMYVLMIPIAVTTGYLIDVPLIASAALLQLVLASSLPAENCLVARFCPAAWHARAYGVKFVLALGVASIAVPLAGLSRDETGSFSLFFMAIAAFAMTIVAFAIFLPKAGSASETIAPAPVAGAAE